MCAWQIPSHTHLWALFTQVPSPMRVMHFPVPCESHLQMLCPHIQKL